MTLAIGTFSPALTSVLNFNQLITIEYVFFYSNCALQRLDVISARLLRECTDLISYSLCEIFNLSIITGVFPEEGKCSKVIPLFKQGEKADMNSYRPISIIPVVAKVFERIIYDQLHTPSSKMATNKLFFCLHVI